MLALHASSFTHVRGHVLRIQTELFAHSPSVPQYQQLPSVSGDRRRWSAARQLLRHWTSPAAWPHSPRATTSAHPAASSRSSSTCRQAVLHLAFVEGFLSHSPCAAHSKQRGSLSLSSSAWRRQAWRQLVAMNSAFFSHSPLLAHSPQCASTSGVSGGGGGGGLPRA